MKNISHSRFVDTGRDVIVGIDEAGRGPVIGHLVYAALISTEEEIRATNFCDSKITSPAVREKQFGLIEKQMSYTYRALHPQYLTENMLCRSRNLNTISFGAVFDILDEICRNYKVRKVFVDTVGDPQKYRKMLEERYKCSFVVDTKADAKYRIVSGASIVAKVTRDGLIKRLDPTCGSGYPADPVTVNWLKRNLNPVFGYPEIVRFSWATIGGYLPPRKSRKMKGTFEGFYLTDE